MIYFDQASTSFPKAPGLGQAMAGFIETGAININRGSYGSAYALAEEVFTCRENLAHFFGADDPAHVVFTANVTQSLNMALHGFLAQGDHVLISPLEHNAVMRPLAQLEAKGVFYDFLPADSDGYLQVENFAAALLPGRTKAIICAHASNLSGIVQDLKGIGDFCHQNNLAFIVDAAQTAGLWPIDVNAMHISCLCFTGHKALLGPQGIGGMIVTDDFAQALRPLLQGGTGSFSMELTMPPLLPDKLEAGTLNLPGIIGLKHALQYIQSPAAKDRLKEELALTEVFLRGIEQLKPQVLRRIGPAHRKNRTAVVSLTVLNPQFDLAFLAHHLDIEYQIQTRVGFHCTPAAHRFYQSNENGALRFSFSHFNTQEEIAICLDALEKLLAKA